MQKVNARTVTLTILFLLILVVVALLIGNFTTAYLGADVGDDVTTQGETTASGDTIIFSSGNSLSLHATTDNFNASSGNLTDTTNPSARLIASSRTNEANATYYAGIRINANTFTYSSGTTADVILTVRDETGAIVTTSDDNNLTYVTVTDASGTSISGFDITGKTGAFNISIEHPISTTSSTSGTTHTWTFTITFVNYTYDQSINENATLDMDVVLQKDEIVQTLADLCTGKTLAECITTQVYTGIDGENSLYYHDADLANGAGDNSYRYSGANPNNYVCFGSEEATCPEDNLYRIIGVFNGQVKLIKLNSIGNYMWDGDNVNFNSIVNLNSQSSGYLVTQLGDILAAPETQSGTNTWSVADINYYINNDYFYNDLAINWQDIIATTNWQVGGGTQSNLIESNAQTAYNYEVGADTANTTHNARIGLMYVSDYYYGALPVYWSYFGYGNSTDDYRVAITDNWMYTGIYEWTITRNSDTTNYAFQVFHDGRIAHNLVNEGTVPGVRPSFYLQPWVLYSGGNGTQENPYRLSIATDNTG